MANQLDKKPDLIHCTKFIKSIFAKKMLRFKTINCNLWTEMKYFMKTALSQYIMTLTF